MHRVNKWIATVLILAGACLVSALLAFGNYYYYQWINGFFHVTDVLLSALLYSSFLIVIGLAVIVWKPRDYGFQAGECIKKWKLVLGVSVAACAFTVICLSLTPRTPYSGANWMVEMLVVPFSEELIWRGILFTFVSVALGKLHGERVSLVLSVIISSVAFGLAHVSNVLVHPVSFVFLQMLFAAIVGLAMGYLRAKTKSVYPAMLVHALFNMVAILY